MWSKDKDRDKYNADNKQGTGWPKDKDKDIEKDNEKVLMTINKVGGGPMTKT